VPEIEGIRDPTDWALARAADDRRAVARDMEAPPMVGKTAELGSA
jgi:hypothetical protein